ncbi:uncharacterized protein [Henckelia pumila]|uniref:uncharacterized protein n=1 Tax=Henckelia pumila TaxID=405737 RepID=UPI003C6DFA3F
MEDFDCIIEIDLLTTYRAILDCYQRFVQFRPEDGEARYFYGEGVRPPMPVVFALKSRRALKSGGEGYLIYAIDASLEGPDIQEIPVVREFPDVFPEDIPGLPPAREIEFGIELVPGTTPISRAPYRLAPSDMREFQNQLQDLLDKGYIRRSVSPWGDPRRRARVPSPYSTADTEREEVTEAILNWSRPTTISEIRSFLGKAGYYRRFVENFSQIAKPLTQLTRKDVPFVWTSECEESFHELRRRLTTAPVLALPSGSGGFVVHTDASLQGLGCNDDLLCLSGRVVVPNDSILQEEILSQAHRSRFSVHPGSMKMNCDSIWVVVDRLSKSAHFLPYNWDFTFVRMARLYVQEVVRLHGIPLSIYVADESRILHPTEVQLDQDLSYVERPLRILDMKDKVLRNKSIPLMMVQWQRRGTEEATWELESQMRAEHPELFRYLCTFLFKKDLYIIRVWGHSAPGFAIAKSGHDALKEFMAGLLNMTLYEEGASIIVNGVILVFLHSTVYKVRGSTIKPLGYTQSECLRALLQAVSGVPLLADYYGLPFIYPCLTFGNPRCHSHAPRGKYNICQYQLHGLCLSSLLQCEGVD